MEKNELMKRKLFANLLIILIGCLLTACNGEKERFNKTGEVTPTEIETSAAPTEKVTPMPAKTVPSQRITWALPFYKAPSKEAQVQINSLLREKGLDCEIDFVEMGVLSDTENEEWVQSKEEQNAVPDVLCSGAWENLSDVAGFLQRHFCDLSSYLMSQEGTILRDAFCEAEWGSVTFGGKMYVVPRTMFADAYNCGVFLSVRKEYESLFEGFDGTYASIKQLLIKTGRKNLYIVFDGLSKNAAYAMLGCSTYAGLPYDTRSRKVLNPTTDESVGKMWNQLYHDIKDGEYVKATDFEEVSDEEVFVCIHAGKRSARDGFVEICLAVDLYEPRMNMTYGISKQSTQKELAFRVLGVCYSDPQIVALLNPNMESAKEVECCRKALVDEKVSELTGFLPILNDIIISGKCLCSETSTIFSQMLSSEKNKLSLAEKYDAVALFRQYESPERSAFVDELNRQMREYCEKTRE